jgi:two-component system CheB/CheR fusion protein
VFDPFQQAAAPGTRRSFGLGLGLTICRGIVEGLGGRLTATSPGLGQGTTFRVELPLAQSNEASDDPRLIAEPGTGPQAAIEATTPGRRLRILLVDDEPDTARFLAHVLGSHGHEVVVASSLSAAREAVAAPGLFDLLISDIELPDGTGLDLMRERGGAFPAIALSGYGAEEDRAETRRAGFHAHLTKPVEADRLCALVAQVARGEPITQA